MSSRYRGHRPTSASGAASGTTAFTLVPVPGADSTVSVPRYLAEPLTHPDKPVSMGVSGTGEPGAVVHDVEQ